MKLLLLKMKLLGLFGLILLVAMKLSKGRNEKISQMELFGQKNVVSQDNSETIRVVELKNF